jgi:hypothetical protein
MIKRVDHTPHPDDAGLMMNEILAVAWAIELINSDLGAKIKLSRKSHSEFLYDLHYRAIGEDALLALFQMILDLARGKKENPVIEFGV